MSRMFAGEIIFSGFDERRTFPVATGSNRMPSAGATRASSPFAVPTHSTSTERPSAANRAWSACTAVNAGYVCPPVPPPVTTNRNSPP